MDHHIFHSICSEFESIKERCITAPEDSEEMMQMIDFVKEARTTGKKIYEIRQKLKTKIKNENKIMNNIMV